MPDLVAYNVALSVIARSGRDDVALAMLERMRKDGELLLESAFCRFSFILPLNMNAGRCSSRAFVVRSILLF